MHADVFVTPTAQRQFREALARYEELSDEEIIDIVQRGCAIGDLTIGTRPNGSEIARVRALDIQHGNRLYSFRALVVPPRDDESRPAVVSIQPGSRAKRRQGKASAERTKAKWEAIKEARGWGRKEDEDNT